MNRLELVSKLSVASKALGANALFPVFQCFRLIGKRGIFSSNGSASIFVPADMGVDLDITIPARSFMDLVKSMEQEEVVLKQTKKSLIVSCGKVKGKFLPFDAAGGLKAPKYKSKEWPKVNKDVLEACIAASFATSTFETGGVLKGVHIAGSTVCATDKFRAVRCHLPKKVKQAATIPPRFIGIVEAHKSEVRRWMIDKRMVYVKLKDGTIITSTLYEGDYPDFGSIIPSDTKGMMLLKFGKGFVDIAHRHSAFLKDLGMLDREMKVSVEPKQCVLSSQHETLGLLEEKVKLKKGSKVKKPFSFVINPEYVKDLSGSHFYYSPKRGLVYFKTKSFEYVALTKCEGK